MIEKSLKAKNTTHLWPGSWKSLREEKKFVTTPSTNKVVPCEVNWMCLCACWNEKQKIQKIMIKDIYSDSNSQEDHNSVRVNESKVLKWIEMVFLLWTIDLNSSKTEKNTSFL